MRNILFAALIAVALVGCKSAEQQPAPVDDKSGTGAAGTGAETSGATTGAVTGTTGRTGANPLKDPSNILSKRNVYFDFDSFVVKEEYKPMIEAHARYLQQNRNARMTVQGNADERGSPEYNIALGQRRADAVKRMMVLLGATDIQIETVSFGKEKPRREGHDETAWTENRRVDIVHAGE